MIERRRGRNSLPYLYDRENYMYLYIMGAGDYIKIGTSKYPEKRLKQIQTGNPNKIVLEDTALYDWNSAHKIEKIIHTIFSGYAVTGPTKTEWFQRKILQYLLPLEEKADYWVQKCKEKGTIMKLDDFLAGETHSQLIVTAT